MEKEMKQLEQLRIALDWHEKMWLNWRDDKAKSKTAAAEFIAWRDYENAVSEYTNSFLTIVTILTETAMKVEETHDNYEKARLIAKLEDLFFGDATNGR